MAADTTRSPTCQYCRCESLVTLQDKPMCESHLAPYLAGMDDGLASACRTLDKIAALSPSVITSHLAHAHA